MLLDQSQAALSRAGEDGDLGTDVAEARSEAVSNVAAELSVETLEDAGRTLYALCTDLDDGTSP